MMNHDDDRFHGPEPASRRPSARPLTLHECENSHTFFFPHEACPRCAARLVQTEGPPDAVLVSHTTVRVSPAAAPFRLGIARVASGAQTLCIIDGEPGEGPEPEVVIEKRGALYFAKAKRPA